MNDNSFLRNKTLGVLIVLIVAGIAISFIITLYNSHRINTIEAALHQVLDCNIVQAELTNRVIGVLDAHNGELICLERIILLPPKAVQMREELIQHADIWGGRSPGFKSWTDPESTGIGGFFKDSK